LSNALTSRLLGDPAPDRFERSNQIKARLRLVLPEAVVQATSEQLKTQAQIRQRAECQELRMRALVALCDRPWRLPDLAAHLGVPQKSLASAMRYAVEVGLAEKVGGGRGPSSKITHVVTDAGRALAVVR
jgi:hypothetical protein